MGKKKRGATSIMVGRFARAIFVCVYCKRRFFGGWLSASDSSLREFELVHRIVFARIFKGLTMVNFQSS